MDPTIAKLFDAGMAERHGLSINDHTTRMGRMADAALYDLRVIAAVTAKELLVSDDMGDVLRANMASAAPSTLTHPAVGPLAPK